MNMNLAAFPCAIELLCMINESKIVPSDDKSNFNQLEKFFFAFLLVACKQILVS